MIALQEEKKYCNKESVWIGKFEDFKNSAHWHNEYEICYVDKGTITLNCNGEEFHLFEGMAFLVSSREVHNMQAEKGSILSFIMFSKDLGDSIMAGYKIKNPILKGYYDIPGAYNRIKAEMENRHIFYEQVLNAEIINLIIDIFRHEQLMEINCMTDDVNDFSGLMQEIEKKYAYYTFEEAAEYMGLNKTYFSSLFHKFANMTFSQYLNRVRITKAIEMLNAEKQKITDVAMTCGFDSVRNFNRVFKEITGFAPKQLPADYILPEYAVKISTKSFNPIHHGSILLESSDRFMA